MAELSSPGPGHSGPLGPGGASLLAARQGVDPGHRPTLGAGLCGAGPGRGPWGAGRLFQWLRGRVCGADSVALGVLSLLHTEVGGAMCLFSLCLWLFRKLSVGPRRWPFGDPQGRRSLGLGGPSLEKPLVSLVFSSCACGREETWGPFRPF